MKNQRRRTTLVVPRTYWPYAANKNRPGYFLYVGDLDTGGGSRKRLYDR